MPDRREVDAIQSLVLAAKRGDTNARDQLVEHYRIEAQKRAESFARRNGLDIHDVETELVWTIQRCLDAYDDTQGKPYEHLLRVSWVRAQNDVRRKHYESAYNRNVDRFSDVLVERSTPSEEDAIVASLAVDEYKRKVSSANDGATLSKIIDLIVAGVTHEEIAYACGFEGSRPAAKMWTQRKLDDLRRAMLSEGDEVLVKGTNRDGQRGIVVRVTEKSSEFTHVVRLDDAAVRSFRVSELERR